MTVHKIKIDGVWTDAADLFIGPPGPKGDPGAVGPQGPVGPQGGALGVVLFKYRWGTATTPNPVSGRVHANNATPANVTEVYLHEQDDDDNNLSVFWDELDAPDWFNLFLEDDEGVYARFDVLSKPTKTGNVYTIPVAPFDNAGGAFNNGARLNLYARFLGVTNAVVSDEITAIAAVPEANWPPASPTTGVLYLSVGAGGAVSEIIVGQ